MSKLFTYIVYRHGSNAANQGMTPVMPVGTWKARTRAGAIANAGRNVVVYNNQYLTAKLWSKACKWDRQAASEADYANELTAADRDIEQGGGQ